MMQSRPARGPGANVLQMRTTFLGTGGPRPDPARQGPATLVEVGNLSLLFDAGRGASTQLAKAGTRIEDLGAVFITHHHFDHIGGLADLIMAAWNNGRSKTLPIYGPEGTAQIVEAMFEHVYARDINFRIAEEQHLGRQIDHPRQLVAVTDISNGRIDAFDRVTITVGQVEHGSAGIGLTSEEWSACGYRISSGGSAVAISGDAVAGLDLAILAGGADLLVMCAYLADEEILTPEDEFLSTEVLAGARQAADIASEAKAHRLVLTHIREKADAAAERMRTQVSASYAGEVVVAHDLLTIEVP